jgi:hypothetical protein
MHETRTEWAPSVPRGRWCSTRPRHAPQPASAASQRPVPDLGRVLHPFPPTFKMTRHQPRVHSRSPARPSPRPWPPEGTRALRLEPWAPHPAVTRDARQGGDRPPSTSRGITSPPGTSSAVIHSLHATSCRTRAVLPSRPHPPRRRTGSPGGQPGRQRRVQRVEIHRLPEPADRGLTGRPPPDPQPQSSRDR